ncbi:hypothetical protein PIB30_008050 [Stylosanthes scabra]|uniref:Uncharacterized protein n=1 Tax=Stylosanthes scabra TaxID=79078 RepID=A0ABU6W4Q0_9FABA|nr:hypothetical protein [Stylosanthes scabra]
MCRETLEIVLDQDPKGRRIYVPEEVPGHDLEMVEVPLEVEHVQQLGEIGTNLHPGASEQVPQPEAGDGAGGDGGCPT